MGTAVGQRSTRQNFVASKLKVNFFVLLRVTLSALKNSLNSVGTLRVRSGKECFGFKKLLELDWRIPTFRVRNQVRNRVRNRFRNRVGPTFIGLVVQHKERDIYFDTTGIRRLSSEANRYYHRQWECLKARHPYISTPMIQIDPVLLLDDYQRHCLESLLGLSF